VDTAGSGSESEESSEQSEEGGFDQHFADDVEPTGAEGLADRQFFPSAVAADEKEIEEVHSADEQKNENTGLE
jgi:hypothetical protein